MPISNQKKINSDKTDFHSFFNKKIYFNRNQKNKF